MKIFHVKWAPLQSRYVHGQVCKRRGGTVDKKCANLSSTVGSEGRQHGWCHHTDSETIK